MTSLSGDRLVPKTHRRIAFRGIIDTLEAEVIEAQVLASERGEEGLCGNLGEVLGFLRAIMAAEVKESPLPPLPLFGMELEEIRRRVKEMKGPPLLPAYTQGALAARLNTLRAKLREAELLAVRVFGPEGNHGGTGPSEREDIIMALNRLSGALWWLFCEYRANFSRAQL